MKKQHKENALLLIDADILAVAGAASAERKDEDGDLSINSFQAVSTWIDNMVLGIEDTCNSEEVIMFLSGKENFRYDVAKLKPYKSNRKEKPFHTENAMLYIRSRYSTYISKGCEADDLLAMAMTSYRKSDVPCILCTADKDLLQVEGWHYRWEGHNFNEMPPHFVDDLGHLEGGYDEGVNKETGRAYKKFIAKKFKGDGYLWFMAQAIMGDATDTIPGLEGKGPQAAYESLISVTSKQEALEVVINLYKERYGEAYEAALTEQVRLVYMIRHLDKDSPDGLLHWSLEYGINEAKSTPH